LITYTETITFFSSSSYPEIEYLLFVDGRSVVIHYEGDRGDPAPGVTDPDDLRALLASLQKG
jgi:hypothetical protein